LNRRRQPFQGCALPPELPGHVSNPLVHRRFEDRLFTLIVADLPTEKQLQRRTVRNDVDYNKARRSLKVNAI
jgi:hypothetical protein